MAASVSLQEDQAKQKQRIEASKLYFDVPPDEKASGSLVGIFIIQSEVFWWNISDKNSNALLFE